MIVSIHQPNYIPWIGLFYKMAHCDTFVHLDNVQYSNEANHNVNVIKTAQGMLRLKAPVQQHLGDLICNVRTRDELGWKQKHLRALQMNYAKAPYYKEIYAGFSELLLCEYPNLADMNIAINTWIADGFGIHPQFVRTSNMEIASVRETRVIDICVMLGADTYLSGIGARAYEDEQHFTDRNVKLLYTDYQPIRYEQQWEKTGFLSNMCVLDYLFNRGFDWNYVEQAVKEINVNGNR